MAEDKILMCYRCQKELKPAKTFFTYLGHSFYADILKCPECGEVYIPEDLAKGRLAQTEMLLEDK
jgi:hypothetical protein